LKVFVKAVWRAGRLATGMGDSRAVSWVFELAGLKAALMAACLAVLWAFESAGLWGVATAASKVDKSEFS
jgi:hypothetical protein